MQVLQVQLEVRPDPAEVGRARRWARSRLAGSGITADEPIAETLVLIVSELVTNAVVHTGCPAVLRILLRGTPCPAPDPEEPAGDTGRPPGTTGAATGRAPGPDEPKGSSPRRPDNPPDAPDGPHGARPSAPNGRAPRPAPDPRSRPEGTVATEIVVGSVRIEVADTCARPPRPRYADDDSTGGRGLALVDGLADRWGWEPSGAGKRIWCELDRSSTRPARSTAAQERGAGYPKGTLLAFECA